MGLKGTGTGVMLSLNAASTAGSIGSIHYLERAFGNWAMRVKLNGNATGVVVQLRGAVATSSEAYSAASTNGPFAPLTTWSLQVPLSCDDTVFITGKPVTAVLAEVTSLSSTGTTVTAWITGTP